MNAAITNYEGHAGVYKVSFNRGGTAATAMSRTNRPLYSRRGKSPQLFHSNRRRHRKKIAW